MSEEKPAPDWERIEADYRAGILSLREIAALHPGTNHVKIDRWAKKHGWVRDLGARIKAKADELVTRGTVTPDVTAQRSVSDAQIVDGVAQAIATVRLAHRTDIAKARRLCMTLWGELEAQTGNLPTLSDLGEMLRNPDDNGAAKLNDIYRAVITLPERTKTMKALVESLKHLIGLEREAYGLTIAKSPEDDPPPAAADIRAMSSDDIRRRLAEIRAARSARAP